MPFGLQNGPSVFQRFISNSLMDLVRNLKIVVHMDNIVVATRTVEENFEILVQLLERLAKFRLEINFKKSLFLRKVLDYLGYSVSNNGILSNDSHIEVI